MWFCVGFSTLVEIACTQLWGLYHYRLGNVPSFVPPGHGLIFLVAAQGARARWVAANRRAIARVTIAAATALGGWGLFFPRSGAAPDVHGAIYWPFFVAFLARSDSDKAPVYAITFAITTALEVVGVRFGNWTWASTVPGLGMPSADPPSLIAGGYCGFAVAATWLAARARARRFTRSPGSA
jgi:hypothetical protein